LVDLVATVKFNAVVEDEVVVLEVREGATKADVCTGKVVSAPWLETKKCVNGLGSGIGVVKG
jgi:hypothetical protein